jgi:hypothetical protein
MNTATHTVEVPFPQAFPGLTSRSTKCQERPWEGGSLPAGSGRFIPHLEIKRRGLSRPFSVRFEYQGHHFIEKDHQVQEVKASLWLGESHRTSELNASVPVRAIMRDTLHGIDIAALVFEDSADLISVFLVAPSLVAACEELDKLRDKIEFYLQRGREAGRVDEGYYQQIMLALAGVHVQLEARLSKPEVV